MNRLLLSTAIVSIIGLMGLSAGPLAAEPKHITLKHITFKMVPSAGAVGCLRPEAHGRVRVSDAEGGQALHLEVRHLPPNTSFAFFIIQVPNQPFGLSWYQGDLDTDEQGDAALDVKGIFSIETFTLAPGVAPAPKVFPDNATSNPATPPVQMYHLGLWFADPAEAVKAGCPGTVTPFDGDHEAGIQVLNTSNFPDDHGPLRDFE